MIHPVHTIFSYYIQLKVSYQTQNLSHSDIHAIKPNSNENKLFIFLQENLIHCLLAIKCYSKAMFVWKLN